MRHDSDSDELPSEDELLAQFNMTSKRAKSPANNSRLSPGRDLFNSSTSPRSSTKTDRSRSPYDLFSAKPTRSQMKGDDTPFVVAPPGLPLPHKMFI